MRSSLKYGFPSLAALIAGCPGDFFQPGGTVVLNFDFDSGFYGWVAGVSDYSVPEADIIDFESGLQSLPDEVDENGRGYFLSSSNRSDDLFVFLKRQLGPLQGLEPNQAYTLTYSVRIASNAPSGCFGAGGSPGESVYVKVGGSTTQPEPLDPDESGYIALSVDKGNQAEGGPAATVIGNLANGDPCDDPSNAPYVSIVRTGEHEEPVTTDGKANLWLLVGTDSGFEGITEIYIQSIYVVLTPIEVPGDAPG